MSLMVSVLCERAVNVGLGRRIESLDASLILEYYKVSGMSPLRLAFADTM
jgi:hypothetical protein